MMRKPPTTGGRPRTIAPAVADETDSERPSAGAAPTSPDPPEPTPDLTPPPPPIEPVTAPTQAFAPPPQGRSARVAVMTAIFAAATAVSRVAGLAREVIQASIFGTSSQYSAFTIASQIPNLFSNLFSQAALGAAFVPIFTDLLAKGDREQARRIASELMGMLLVILGALTVLYIAVAGLIMPLFVDHGISGGLTANLSRILFPVVLLLSVTGLLTGILQAYDEFTVPAIAPAVWNLVIIGLLLVLHTQFKHSDEVYAYAIAWLVATVVQLALVALAMRRIDFRFGVSLNWRDPLVRRVLILFLPVTMSIGIINLDAFLNTELGVLVNGQAPAAISDAFRLYMLPQGIFSVAVTTVLFPSLARMANASDAGGMRSTIGQGIRQINLLLIPSAALMAVLAVPIVRLVYQHHNFGPHSTHLVSTALFWFAISLPFSGVNLLLTRTFFALQRPWIPTRLAVMNMIVDVIVSLALYRPLGIAGLIIGTLAANIVMTALQLYRLRTGFNGRLELEHTLMITARILAATAVSTAVGWAIWRGLYAALGPSLPGGLVELGLGLGVGVLLYGRLALVMRIPEAQQVVSLVTRRLRGATAPPAAPTSRTL
jgi:putative peptidoglycan lipid II flippase